MPLPLNRNQLELLTSAQAAAIDAALRPGSLKVAELVKVSWPSPDDPKVYSWWNCLADPAYTTPLTDWLDGAPLIPAFVAKDQNKAERFHRIPRTSALSDDVVPMEFSNYGQVFEELAVQYRGGVRVEIFYFFPEIEDDANSTDYTVISWFLGHLKKGGRANADFVPMNAVNGFRSPHIVVPSRINGSNCQHIYNGDKLNGARVHPTGIPDNPCDIDKHYGGTKGTLDPGTGELWAFCNHTLADCTKINGTEVLAREIYGGDDYTTPPTKIGGGDHTTVSKDIGNETRLDQPIPVPYGTYRARALQLWRYAKEYSPDDENQGEGTIRTVFGLGHGPVQSITAVKVMDRELPRTDGLGLETRLGTQRQSATDYAPNMMNLNRLAHFRGDVNPVDPNGVQATDIVAQCDFEGRNTLKIYAAGGSYTQGFTNNRADVLVDQLCDPHYGYKMDVARLELADIVYLRALNSPFDCYVGGATIQQRVEDICGAASGGESPQWFRPFVYNGKIRILPVENIDLTAADIPQIIDAFGSTRNVVFDKGRKVTFLEPEYRDNDEIANAYVLAINDADADYTDRPLTFEAWDDQYREGELFGDLTKRRDPKPFAAYGLTHLGDVRPLGEFLVRNGPFGTGGLSNNCSVEFTICAISSIGLNLHENKIVKLPTASNPKLVPYKDEDGDPFEYFLVTSMERDSRLNLRVKAQAWSPVFWDEFCVTPAGSQTGYVIWPADDLDSADGPQGTRTLIYSVAADRQALSVTWPDTIDPDEVLTDFWRHTIIELPSVVDSYFIGHPAPELGFRVWGNGQLWVYRDGGIVDYPDGTLLVGDTLTVEFDRNGGSEERTYKHNSTTLHTDTGGTVANATNEINGICNTTGDWIGPVEWGVTYDGCVSKYAVQPVGLSGGSTTSGTPGSGTDEFDVLAYQVHDRAEENLEVEVMS